MKEKRPVWILILIVEYADSKFFELNVKSSSTELQDKAQLLNQGGMGENNLSTFLLFII